MQVTYNVQSTPDHGNTQLFSSVPSSQLTFNILRYSFRLAFSFSRSTFSLALQLLRLALSLASYFRSCALGSMSNRLGTFLDFTSSRCCILLALTLSNESMSLTYQRLRDQVGRRYP